MERSDLGTGSAHFNGSAAGVGDVLVFLAEGAVGVDLYLVLAVGKLFKIFAELVHADGFGFTFGLHAGDLDDFGGLSGADHGRGADHQTHDQGKSNKAFHKSSSELVQVCRLLAYALRHSREPTGMSCPQTIIGVCEYVFRVLYFSPLSNTKSGLFHPCAEETLFCSAEGVSPSKVMEGSC